MLEKKGKRVRYESVCNLGFLLDEMNEWNHECAIRDLFMLGFGDWAYMDWADLEEKESGKAGEEAMYQNRP